MIKNDKRKLIFLEKLKLEKFDINAEDFLKVYSWKFHNKIAYMIN